MSKLLQLRGGTTSEHSSFTGALREVTVDTTKDTLVVHDGSTAGGFAIPRTGAEIVALVEGTSGSNTFTDADHTKLNAIEASATADQSDAEIKTSVESATSIALGGSPTTTTQSAADNSTKVATTAYTDAAVAALADSAPATLNTLNELAAALGDDASYATTTATALGLKAPLASPTFTGTVGLPAGAIGLASMASGSVDEDNLLISNAPTNGYFLSAQSGNSGGLTWAEVDTTIANDAIDSQHYAAGSVDLEHMSVNSVDSDQYVDGSIDTAHIADDAVTADKLANSINTSIAAAATTGKAIAMSIVFG